MLHVIISFKIIKETLHQHCHNYLPIFLLHLIKRKMLQLGHGQEEHMKCIDESALSQGV